MVLKNRQTHNAGKQPPVNESYPKTSSFSFFSRAQKQLDAMISKLESIGIQEHGVA